VLKAAAVAGGATPQPVDIARWAKAVENDFIGVPCGIMDQMAVAIAGERDALFLDTATLRYETIPAPEGWRFAVVHSGITRALNEGRYGERRRECDAAAAALGASFLCQIDDETLARADALAEPLRRRARHAALEHRRTLRAAAAMRAGDAKLFGALMVESHASLRDDFEVSLPAIDRMVVASLAAGAIGARLTGGGFGGCIVSLVDASEERAWAARLSAAEPGVSFVC
jgi:galactokinase